MFDQDRLAAFFDNLLRTDFQLGENILSKDEYRNALNGKRHLYDEAIQTASQAAERKLAAILFSDIVGFTKMMESSEAETLRAVEANEIFHQAALTAHRGRLIKKLGDGMLLSFDSAWEAVSAARDIRDRVRQDGSFEVRIGIHLGEVVQGRHDVHGDGVNVASRIQAEMGPGQIGISKVVYDNVKNQDGFSARSLGERSLKNVSAPMGLYEVGD
jgi:class 3 adenylate cyclase